MSFHLGKCCRCHTYGKEKYKEDNAFHTKVLLSLSRKDAASVHSLPKIVGIKFSWIKERNARMKKIKVPFNGKGYVVYYKVETIDTSMTPVPFFNVYSVFIDDPELQKIVGEHFTLLHNPTITIKPLFDVSSSGAIEEKNLKKEIAQQIMNNPTE